MGRLAWLFSIAGILVLSACAHQGKSHAGGPADTQSTFETAEDPPVKAQTYYAAGQLSETQGRFDNAIRQYEAALKVDPHHVASLYRLAMVYTHLKQFDKAIAVWEKYVVETGQDAGAYANLALAQASAGQREAAEASYQQGLIRDPKNAACRVNYGLLLASEGRGDEAMEQFLVVLTPAQAHYNLGSVYEQQRKIEQARTEYQTAVKLDPSFIDAQKRLARLP